MATDIQQLEQKLAYTFLDQRLLLQAVTHPSYLHESSASVGAADYQRLEFLGDAILGMLLAEMLYDRYPDKDEGFLSRLRSRLAGQDVLADRARVLDLGSYIRFGRGEKLTVGWEKDSILADVLEALLAALYRDGGLQATRGLVSRLFDDLAAMPETIVLGLDSKSELQEYLSQHNYPAPQYRLLDESGPSHNPMFRFQVLSDEKAIGEGCGKSKKIAQQAAAAAALEMLHRQHSQK